MSEAELERALPERNWYNPVLVLQGQGYELDQLDGMSPEQMERLIAYNRSQGMDRIQRLDPRRMAMLTPQQKARMKWYPHHIRAVAYGQVQVAEGELTRAGEEEPVGYDYGGVPLVGEGPEHWQRETPENAAVLHYQGDGHYHINKHLREIETGHVEHNVAREIIPHLDAALDPSRPHTRVAHPGAVVYRGIGAMLGGREFPTEGTFTDPGFVSTSTYRDVADSYTKGPRSMGQTGNRIAKIHLPPGMPVIPIGHTTMEDPWGESELLLPRGQHFDVHGIEPETGDTVIRMHPYRPPGEFK